MPPALPCAILVVGGTGAFGERLVRGILATTELRVIVAARGLARTEALAAALDSVRADGVNSSLLAVWGWVA